MKKENNEVLYIKIEKATYKEQELVEYNGNPYIEALPSIFSEQEIINNFYNIPNFNEDFSKLSKSTKFHVLERIKTYTLPMQNHVSIAHKLSVMIRQGYIGRNPITPESVRNLKQLENIYKYDGIELSENTYIKSTADSFTILGISGIGKTTAVEKLLSMYPQVITHSNYNNKHLTRSQIVWLKIDCPYDGSLATLCRGFFSAIDNLFGTNYAVKYSLSTRITSTMLLYMTKLAYIYGIGVLVIDEIQQLLTDKNNIDEMLNFFVTFTNTVGIPTILVGTPKAEVLFKGNFRQPRRASSNGFLMWDRMKKDDMYWKLFLQQMFEMQCLDEKTELSEDLFNEMYDQSQGITSVAKNLFIFAQSRAISENKSKITVELIKKTAKEDFKLLQPMIKALRTNNIREIAKYDDITIDYDLLSNNIVQQTIYRENIANVVAKKENESKYIKKNIIDNIYEHIKYLDIVDNLSDNILYDIISTIVEDNNKEDIKILKKLCITKLMNYDKPKEVNKKANVTKSNSIRLTDIYDRCIKRKIHPVKELKKLGFIRNPMEELIC